MATSTRLALILSAVALTVNACASDARRGPQRDTSKVSGFVISVRRAEGDGCMHGGPRIAYLGRDSKRGISWEDVGNDGTVDYLKNSDGDYLRAFGRWWFVPSDAGSAGLQAFALTTAPGRYVFGPYFAGLDDPLGFVARLERAGHASSGNLRRPYPVQVAWKRDGGGRVSSVHEHLDVAEGIQDVDYRVVPPGDLAPTPEVPSRRTLRLTSSRDTRRFLETAIALDPSCGHKRWPPTCSREAFLDHAGQMTVGAWTSTLPAIAADGSVPTC